MNVSIAALQSASQDAVLAAVPLGQSNYTGIAYVFEAPGGVVQFRPDQEQYLQNACLFPIALVRRAIGEATTPAAWDELVPAGGHVLPGGDWGIWKLPPHIQRCAEYHSFKVELMGWWESAEAG